MMLKFYVGCLVMLLASTFSASAQDTLHKPAADTISVVNQIHSDRVRFQKIDSVTQLQMLAGHVFLTQDNTKFYCDSAVINKAQNILEAFGNVHINDADSIHTYAQYLIYHIDKKLAILKKKVSLTDGKGVLTTEELQYDTRAKTGVYTTGGKIVNGKTVITSKEATYYGDLKDVFFKKDVKMRDPQYDLDTDSLLYNTETQLSTFITKTYIKDSTGATIITSDGFYDMKNKKASFGKRSVIKDGKGLTVTGDNIFTDSSGVTTITGNGVYIDTAQKISVMSNQMVADKKKKTFLATQHPLMIIEQDKDSIYVSADTLFSARVADLSDSVYRDLRRDTLKNITVINAGKDTSDTRFFQCYHHVRIFSDSLQAISDSLFYSARDSVFRLFSNPIVWASQSQVTGDTIYLFTKNKKAERMYVFENSFAVNKSGENMYNQVSGKTLNGYFKDGAIDYMRTKGSPAHSIYYAKDENDAMVGVNNASGDIIDMLFENKELKKVVFRTDVTGTMYPFKQTPEEKKQLRSFKWLENKRPKTKFELFEDPVTHN
jgi:lipopolysaccharide export system protein LptA